MKRFLRTFLLIVIMTAVFAVAPAFADDKAYFQVFNPNQVTSDLDATYVTGIVYQSEGQLITIGNGKEIVARKYMPVTGDKAAFRLKIPRAYLDENAANSFVLSILADDGTEKIAYLKISYKEKRDQTISVENEELKLNVPGDNGHVNAKASSGLDLEYSSSDDSVVTVNDKGELEPIGQGEAEITISQSNSSEYKNASTTIKVAVKERPYYTVVFHSFDREGKETTVEQKIAVEEDTSLMTNTLSNGDYTLLGWASSENGRPVYDDGESVKGLAERNETVDLYAVWKGARAQAAADWAVMIANDDSFAYGTGSACHRCGCYFCGTNQWKKPKGYEKTYVCITFTGAAYAHGANDPEILATCKAGKLPMYGDDTNFTKFSCWEKVGSCRSLTIDDLEPGDILVKYGPSGNCHTCIYTGDDNIAEAAYEGWGAGTISNHSGASKRLRSLGNSSSKNYVMRYKY